MSSKLPAGGSDAGRKDITAVNYRIGTAKALVEVATGRRMADLYVKNARLVNVYSGELLPAQGVAVWQERIAYVGTSQAMVGESTRVIDAQGMFLLPGFIDAHAHADALANPIAWAEAVLPLGTTCIMTDVHDIVAALGSPGLDLMLDTTKSLPIKFFFAVPSANPHYPQWEGSDTMSLEVAKTYMGRERALSLSEIVPWPRLLALDEDLLARIALAKRHSKRVEGHTAGASPDKLNALVAAGITSCHESIQPEQVMERLRLGLFVMLRHGSIRADLEALAPPFVQNPDLDTSRVMLTPDNMFPSDILKLGYMDYLVATAIQLGISPVKAIQMATINPATYLGLDTELGGIAPGRLADLLLVEDIRKPRPHVVIANGKQVAMEGRLTVELGTFPIQAANLPWRSQRRLQRQPCVQDFEVKAPAGSGPVITVPAIHLAGKVLTQRREVNLPASQGRIELPPESDVLKISALRKDGSGFVSGFLSGLGAGIGGLATTIAHDAQFPMVIGKRDEDMLLAFKHVLNRGGGVAVVNDGAVVAELHLPVGGLLSLSPVDRLAGEMEKVNEFLKSKGCSLDDPLFTLTFLSFASLPALRMTPSGVLDVKAGKIIFP